jgi:hypothetical protein
MRSLLLLAAALLVASIAALAAPGSASAFCDGGGLDACWDFIVNHPALGGGGGRYYYM